MLYTGSSCSYKNDGSKTCSHTSSYFTTNHFAHWFPLSDPSEYRAIVGSLQFLLLTWPNIAFSVNKLSQFMHKPTSDHWLLVKRLLRYLCGSVNEGILLYRDSPQMLHAFSDADWVGNKDDFTSTSANIVYLGRNKIS